MKRTGWLGATVIECDCAQFIIAGRLHELGAFGVELRSLHQPSLQTLPNDPASLYNDNEELSSRQTVSGQTYHEV